MRLFLLLLLAYVLQTTMFGSLWLKPDIFLLLAIIFSSSQVLRNGLVWFGTGLFLDLFNGFSFFNTASYGLSGILIGFLPRDIFRDKFSLGIFQMFCGTILIQGFYALLSKIFLKILIIFPWYLIVLQIIFNILIYSLIYVLFLRDKLE